MNRARDAVDAQDGPRRPWPADPASAWAEAVRSPGHIVRLADPPRIDGADADSIADWLGAQRSPLPIFALAGAVAGAILVVGLSLGVFPLSGRGGTPAWLQWAGGVALLIASAALWAWEARRRRRRPPLEIPPVRMVLCELHPTAFRIHDGDGYLGTCVAIDAEASDAQAATIRTAFRVWLARLHADPDAAKSARDELWQPPGVNVFASEEIFGPEAVGGYLVRSPNRPADGWGLLLTRRRPATMVGELRFADVLRLAETGWSL